jgi:hypothetical protein
MAVVAGNHGNAAAGEAAAVPRRKKTAAERRGQRARAQARAIAHLLAGFKEVETHRGNAVSRTATTFSRALRCLSSGGWVLHEKTVASATSSVASSCGAELATSVGLEVRDADVVPALSEVRWLASAASVASAIVARAAPAPDGVGFQEATVAERLRDAEVAPAPVDGQGLQVGLQGLRGEAASSVRLRAADVAPAPDGVGSRSQSAALAASVASAIVAMAPAPDGAGSRSQSAASAASVASAIAARRPADVLGVHVQKVDIKGIAVPNVSGTSSCASASTASVDTLRKIAKLAQNENDARRVAAESAQWDNAVDMAYLARSCGQIRDALDIAGEGELLNDVQTAFARDDGSELSRFTKEEKGAIMRVAGRGCALHVMEYSELLLLLMQADRGLWERQVRVSAWSQRPWG